MARSDRVHVTVSPAMSIALEVLAARNGVTVAAQATMSLRAALARTMETPEVQRRMASRRAQRTQAQWREDTTTEHAVEADYARVVAREQAQGT